MYVKRMIEKEIWKMRILTDEEIVQHQKKIFLSTTGRGNDLSLVLLLVIKTVQW